ncbi:MAG: caspase family protein, partial [Sphaerochaeta sp.]
FFLCCSCELRSPPPRRVFHLAIGLSYRGTDVQVLEGPIHDAIELTHRFEEFFIEEEYSSMLLLQQGDMFGSYDSSEVNLPTKEHVTAMIKEMLDRAGMNDVCIITYSGHAIEDGSLVLAPTRADGFILRSFDPTLFLSPAELIALLDDSPSPVLLILDCCYAGNFIPPGSDVSTIEQKGGFLQAYEAFWSAYDVNPHLFVLAATTKDNTSKEPRYGTPVHGYFTKALLEALQTPTPRVSLDQIYRYIHANQKIPTEGTNALFYQHPVISGGAYDLILRHSTSPRSIR